MIDPGHPDFANTPASGRRPRFGYQPAEAGTLPSVSIVTPFHDTGAVFHETADSVLAQSFQSWEWLIINDGSSDREALRILDTYRGRDPRIRVIDHPANLGLSAARNTGFAESRTAYVVQLDSDDLLEPTAVEKWYWYLESHPGVAFCKGWSLSFGAQEYLWEKGFHDGSAFLEDNQVDATCMIRREVHQAVQGYDVDNRGGLEDWEFWLKCASRGYWGDTVPEYLNWYRRRADHGDRWPNWSDKKEFRERLRQRYAALWVSFPKHGPAPGGKRAVQSVPPPVENRLGRTGPRALIITSALTGQGGAGRYVDLVRDLAVTGWESTVVATDEADHSSLAAAASHTPDVFVLGHFLPDEDYPRFLRYLIRSRQVDVVVVAEGQFSRLIQHSLRAHFPGVAFVAADPSDPDWSGSVRTARRSPPGPVLAAGLEAEFETAAIEGAGFRTRIRALEQEVERLRQQMAAAETVMLERERRIGELEAWIRELESGKGWLERELQVRQEQMQAQLQASQERAAASDRAVAETGRTLSTLRGSVWVRLGRMLGLLPDDGSATSGPEDRGAP